MFEDMLNFLRLSDTLFSGGMPTAEQLRDGTKQGLMVVINLALHNAPDALAGEEELVRSLGMQYINIPVNWNNPTRDGLDKFMDAMDEHQGQKVLVHCQANYRASAFISLYRVLRQGWMEEDALRVMHQVWDEQAYPVWRLFIEDTLKRNRHGS